MSAVVDRFGNWSPIEETIFWLAEGYAIENNAGWTLLPVLPHWDHLFTLELELGMRAWASLIPVEEGNDR